MFPLNRNTLRGKKRRKSLSSKERHQTSRPFTSTQPQRVVEGQKARDDRVRDNFPANAVASLRLLLRQDLRREPVSPRNNTDQQGVRVPSPQVNDQRSVHLTPRRIVRTYATVASIIAASNRVLGFAAVSSSPCPDHRVTATDNGDPRRGVWCLSAKTRVDGLDECPRQTA